MANLQQGRLEFKLTLLGLHLGLNRQEAARIYAARQAPADRRTQNTSQTGKSQIAGDTRNSAQDPAKTASP
jgi:hypothetical protein